MRLAICTDWGDRKSAFYSNKDGFLRMLQVLRERDGWETRFFRKHPEETFVWEHDCITAHVSPTPAKHLLGWKPDAILFFCDFSRDIMGELDGKGIPMAQCYTGGRFTTYATVPDIVFTESKSYIDWMKSHGVKKVVQAFGTNTELFKPYPQPKIIDALFPATFASWKRHKLFCEAMGPNGIVCGWWQEHEMEIIRDAFKTGVGILHHQMAESMALLYSMARTVVVTSNDHGGSQRTVLEALACNIPTIVMNDSTMTSEYVRECGFGAIVEPNVEAIRAAVEQFKGRTDSNTREWVMQNYSEYIYADKVRDGILSIC
jgi:glycosyltransferase involved in cell wall biosynthesis